jgi:hypothetical protein
VIILLLQSAWRDQKFLKHLARSSPPPALRLRDRLPERFCEQEYRVLSPVCPMERQYDMFAPGVVIGRISKANAAPVGTTVDMDLGFGYHENCTPTHGYEATGEAAMAASSRAGGASK